MGHSLPTPELDQLLKKTKRRGKANMSILRVKWNPRAYPDCDRCSRPDIKRTTHEYCLSNEQTNKQTMNGARHRPHVVRDFLCTLMQVSTQISHLCFGAPPLRAVGEKKPSQGCAMPSLGIPLHGAGLTCKVKTRRLYCEGKAFFLFYDWEIK